MQKTVSKFSSVSDNFLSTTTSHLELLIAKLKYGGKSHLERGTYTIAIGKF